MRDRLDRSFISSEGDRLGTHFPTKSDRATFRLDSTRSPKEITVTWERDIPHVDGDVQDGIYELDGDTLRVCLAPRLRRPRPTKFVTAGHGEYTTLLVLRRER